MSENLIELDGSILEGGGQILRQSVALSALLRKPIKISKIRAKRSKPGLKAQHLTGIRLAAAMCSAKLVGDQLHSSEIEFFPGEFSSTPKSSAQSSTSPSSSSSSSSSFTISTLVKEVDDINDKTLHYIADPGTAGSVCLLLQISMPLALLGVLSPSVCITCRGGTNASMAPQLDYLTSVLLPILDSRFGISHCSVEIERRGFFPRGGGEFHFRLEKMPDLPLPALTMIDRGQPVSIEIMSYTAGSLHTSIGGRMAKAARKGLSSSALASVPLEEKVVHFSNCVGAGCGILIILVTSTGCRLCGSALGEKRVPAEKVAAQAVTELCKSWDLGGCTDEYLQDQLNYDHYRE